ncbi:hypothetical protein V2G26_011530 [Clonostachys chloroleuca]
MAASLYTLSLLLIAGAVAQTCESNQLKVSYPAPIAADGWEYRLVAQGMKKPRSLLFDSDGALIVLDAGVGILRFTLQDSGGSCVSVAQNATLLANKDLNHGLALSEDGKTIYASSQEDVYSWAYDSKSSSLSSDSRRTLITNMTNEDHMTRTLLLSRKQPGTLIVSRGSDEDSDADAQVLNNGLSQIRKFDIGSLNDRSQPFDFLEGDVLGWGLRNSVGIAENPVDGGIWSVENSVDEVTRNGEDIQLNNPGDELNFHGYVNGSAGSLREVGGNYGYPLCYALWETDGFPSIGDLKTGDQFPGGNIKTLSDATCKSDYVAPRLTFPAHTAPLDIKFNKDATAAYISFHGSFNRKPPVGYRIASVNFSNGQPTSASDSRDAAVDVLTTPDLDNCPGNCFRPVGMAWDSQDRMFFASDSTGEVFVLRRTDSSSSGSNTSSGSGSNDSAGASLFVPRMVVAVGAVIAGLLLA